jgi:hypothetical protein
VYSLFRAAQAPPREAHVQALEGTWEEALLNCEEINYLGDVLAPLLAYESLAADTMQHHPRDVWVAPETATTQADAQLTLPTAAGGSAEPSGEGPPAELLAAQELLADLPLQVESVHVDEAATRCSQVPEEAAALQLLQDLELRVEEGNPRGYQ